MRLKKVTQTAVGAAVVIGSLAVGVGYAQADYAPSATDVVGFGGDTPQQPLDFGADGDILGDLGYNWAPTRTSWSASTRPPTRTVATLSRRTAPPT